MTKQRMATMGLAALVGLGMGWVMVKPWKTVLGAFSGEPNACSATALGALPSPGGALRAIWYRRTCADGATVDVSVVPLKGEVEDAPGNALILDASRAQPPLQLAWAPDGGLLIASAPDAQVLERAPSAGGVAIALVPLAPDAGR